MIEDKVVALIPARGGSKRLPGKNIMIFGGKPMIAHSIEFALNDESINEVFVSTDSENIAEISKKYGAKVLERPAGLAGDFTLTNEVVQHHVNDFKNQNIHYEWICILQPTNPIRPSGLATDALNTVKKNKRDSLACFSPLHKKFGKIEANTFIPESYTFGQRSQEIEDRYYENGLIYLVKSDVAAQGVIFSENVYPYIINTLHGTVDVDNIEDFEYASLMLKYFKEYNSK